MKAILVIDVNNCMDCPLGEYIDTHTIRCRDSGEYAPLKKGMHRLKGCRLKPLPKKKLVLEHRIGNLIVNHYELMEAKGYNKCLKEILGETE